MRQVKRLEYAYGTCPKCKKNKYLRYLICEDGMMHPPHEIKCINCNAYFTIGEIHGKGETTMPKPQTNADRIRSYSDEQLADLFSQIETEGRAYGPRGNVQWLNWLQQEATE